MFGLIPMAWRGWVALAAVLAVLAALAGAYAFVRHQGYEAGYSQASAECEAEKREQAEANQAAIRDAEKDLFDAADQLSLKSLELNDALSAIDDAAAADPAGATLCLGPDSVRRLNTIR